MATVVGTSIQGGSIPVRMDDDRRAEEWRLVQAAKEGDVSAFEQLYRNNERKIFGLCFRLASEPTLAEELTQDVFVRAWQKLSSFEGRSAFSSWLYPLAVNVALSERRTRRRRNDREMATDDPTVFERPDRPAAPDTEVDLERAVARLPPGARAVFVLHDVEGYRHEEIASMTGMAEGTSKAQLHRARKLLRERLRR